MHPSAQSLQEFFDTNAQEVAISEHPVPSTTEHPTTAREALEKFTRIVPDFPKPGIVFEDLTPVLAEPTCYQLLVHDLADACREVGADLIGGWTPGASFWGVQWRTNWDSVFQPCAKEASYRLLCTKSATTWNTAVLPLRPLPVESPSRQTHHPH